MMCHGVSVKKSARVIHQTLGSAFVIAAKVCFVLIPIHRLARYGCMAPHRDGSAECYRR